MFILLCDNKLHAYLIGLCNVTYIISNILIAPSLCWYLGIKNNIYSSIDDVLREKYDVWMDPEKVGML